MVLFKSSLTNRHNKQLNQQFKNINFFKLRNKIVSKTNFFLPKKKRKWIGNSRRRIVKAYRFFKFFLLSRKFFKLIYGPAKWQERNFRQFHKKNFKKNKKRLYCQAFFLNIEFRVMSILFKAKIISKINIFKKLLLHKKVLCNGLIVHNFKQMSNPMDIITYPVKTEEATQCKLKPHTRYDLFTNFGLFETIFSLNISLKRVLKHLRRSDLSGQVKLIPICLSRSKNRFVIASFYSLYTKCCWFFSKNLCILGGLVSRLINLLYIKFFMYYYTVLSTKPKSAFYNSTLLQQMSYLDYIFGVNRSIQSDCQSTIINLYFLSKA